MRSWLRGGVFAVLFASAALAEPPDPAPYAGVYHYGYSGAALGLPRQGKARLSGRADALTLELGDLSLEGRALADGFIFSLPARLGASGVLRGLAAGQALTVSLTPRSVRWVAGRVLDPRGRPLATVTLLRSVRDLDYVGFDTAPLSDEAREGLRSILAGEELEYGIPTKLFRLRLASYGQEMLWSMGFVPPGGLPGREGYARLPLGMSSFERDGVRLVNSNCFSCHAGVVTGKVVAGMPSASFDSVTQSLLTDQSLELYRGGGVKGFFGRQAINALLSDEEERRFDGFLDYYQTLVQPSVEDAAVRGDNYGPHVIWRLLARIQRRDGGFRLAPPGEAAALEERLLKNPDGTPRPLPPLTPSPWWHLKYKKTSFWLADVTHRSPTTFSLNLLDELPEDFEGRLQRTQRHLEFARQTVAPRYEGPIDEAAADRGFELYSDKRQGCAKCHGDTDREGRLVGYFDWTYAVGTDPEYAKLVRSFKPLYEVSDDLFATADEKWFAFSGKSTARYPERDDAYLAPPLVGVWASAPYFHNGSVPTLAQVLRPATRARIWERDPDPFDYDHDQLGLRHRVVAPEDYEDLATNVDERDESDADTLRLRRSYDTRGFGRSNAGHRFGEDLTPDQLRDLLEYLKRL